MASPRTLYQMKVASVLDLTPSVRELVVQTAEPLEFSFRAGQFVMLHVPADPKPALRAYSIASDERQKNGFTLLFKYVEGGVASRYVWDLKGGETLQFTGPFGRVFFNEPPTREVVMLNTGTGLSQHLCYLLSKAQQFPETRFQMLFGVRTEADRYYENELNQLAKILPNFSWEFVLSRPSDFWTGKRGHVQKHLESLKYDPEQTTFYLCGNGEMIKQTKEILNNQGVSPTRIHSEAFD